MGLVVSLGRHSEGSRSGSGSGYGICVFTVFLSPKDNKKKKHQKTQHTKRRGEGAKLVLLDKTIDLSKLIRWI